MSNAAETLQVIAAFAAAKVGLGYIYGATGWVCTAKRVEQQATQYPQYADQIRKYGLGKWLNVVCYDCAQLTKAAAKAAGYSLPSGATSQWRSNVWAQKGTIDTLPNEAGVFLYRMDSSGTMQHTGIYMGDGTFVDARGHAYGVERRKMSAYNWTHWATLKTGGTAVPEQPGSFAGQTVTPANLAAGTSTVNMRIAPTTAGKLVRRIKLGEALHCTQDNGEWCYCRANTDGAEGYIMHTFLQARG